MGDHFCLKWNNHQENLTGIMTKLLDEQKFVDVSLVCEMKTFKAHQTVLSACSPYFEQVLEENPHPHPIIILRDVKEGEMSALLQYMYRGEVSVRDDELSAFLHTARALKVRGLSENKRELLAPQSREELSQNSPIAQSVTGNPPKRQRISTSTIEAEITERRLADRQVIYNCYFLQFYFIEKINQNQIKIYLKMFDFHSNIRQHQMFVNQVQSPPVVSQPRQF